MIEIAQRLNTHFASLIYYLSGFWKVLLTCQDPKDSVVEIAFLKLFYLAYFLKIPFLCIVQRSTLSCWWPIWTCYKSKVWLVVGKIVFAPLEWHMDFEFSIKKNLCSMYLLSFIAIWEEKWPWYSRLKILDYNFLFVKNEWWRRV